MAIDPARFSDLVSTVEALRLELGLDAAGGEGLPDQSALQPDIDPAALLGTLVQAVIDLSHCVLELHEDAVEQRRNLAEVTRLASSLIGGNANPNGMKARAAKLADLAETLNSEV
jgi:hypothetical protein